MEEFGRYLKEERLARGISLSAVQVTTRIRTAYLEAIEAGDFASLPGNTYARGFLKLYAKAIGLDPEEVVRRYDALQSQLAEAQELQSPSRERLSERLARRRRKRRIQTLRLAGVLILLAALIVLGREWLLSPESDVPSDGLQVGVLMGNESRPIQDAVEPGDGDANVSSGDSSAHGPDSQEGQIVNRDDNNSGSGGANGSVAETAVGASPVAQLNEPAEEEPNSGAGDAEAVPAWLPAEDEETAIQLTLTYEGLSWSGVWVDGERVVYQNVPEGTVLSWTAQESIRVRLGRGEEVRIELNGEDLGLAGNGVVDREFTIETVRALRRQED